MQTENQKGFILASTLWVLAVLTVAATFFATWTNRVVDEAFSMSEQFEAATDIYSTQSTLLYLMFTRQYRVGGIDVGVSLKNGQRSEDVQSWFRLPDQLTAILKLDDTFYDGIGKTKFSIQDAEALQGLLSTGGIKAERLLGQFKVPAIERRRLLARLADYQDSDELHRLNGAEAATYKGLGKASPPNRELYTPWEIQNVLGWDKYLSLPDGAKLPRLLTTTTGNRINLNTSPLQVLLTVDGMDARMARKLIKSRPYNSLQEVSQAIGRPVNLDYFGSSTMASNMFRMTFFHPGQSKAREVVVKLFPGSLMKEAHPWVIDYDLEFNFEKPTGESKRLATDLFAQANFSR